MARQQGAGILDANVPFHRRHHHIADEAEDADFQPHQGGTGQIQRREQRAEQQTDQQGGDGAAQEALPGLVRADQWQDLASAQGFAPDKLRHIVHLGQKDQ